MKSLSATQKKKTLTSLLFSKKNDFNYGRIEHRTKSWKHHKSSHNIYSRTLLVPITVLTLIVVYIESGGVSTWIKRKKRKSCWINK